MNLSDILTLLGVITPFVLSAAYLMRQITVANNRVLLLEISSRDHEDRIKIVEGITDYRSFEPTVEKIYLKLFNSTEFRDSIEKIVKNAFVHAERNSPVAGLTKDALLLLMKDIEALHQEVSRLKGGSRE